MYKLLVIFFIIKLYARINVCKLFINISVGIDNLDPNYKFAKFGPKTEIFSNFCEILHSEQIEHASYQYNTRQFLERLRDYCLRMIIGSE